MLTQQIGAFEAKTHFSQILEQVERGDDFIVTKRGKPVAKITPIEQEKPMTRKEAIEALREMRKLYRGKPGDDNIKDLIEDGRKY
ncbi:MAG: type II toxin-antitoxin system prevent-host-death family antitoxin [Treponema sp.]|nr:type II toxin-antitoxin system prevent-host-death family antitoxin [Treponema sp.]